MKYYEIKADGTVSASVGNLHFFGKISDGRFSDDARAKFQSDIDEMISSGCEVLHIEQRGINNAVHRTMLSGDIDIEIVQSDAYDDIDNWITFVTHEERDPTPEEIASMTLSPEQEARFMRNQLLAATDFWALSDYTMTDEMAAYRQALRDVPSQAGFPHDIVWPVKP